MNTSHHCIVCDEPESRFLFEKEGYPFLKCPACGFIYVDFNSDESFPTTFYNEDYFVEGHDKYGYADYIAERPNHMHLNAKKVKLLNQFRTSGTLLDVGCAAGYFLESLGPKWEVYGCEPSEFMARQAMKTFGDRIVHSSFEAYSSERTFDVITLWDVIEHLVDPVACIKKAHSLLNDGGFILIGTNDTASPAPRILGKSWYHYIPPVHLYYFNRKNVVLFLNRHGFSKRRIRYFAKYVSLSEIVLNLAYIFRSAKLRGASERLSQSSRYNLNIPFMVFDDMVVVAQKE